MANTWWRDTGRHPRFFIVDAWAVYALLLVVLHLRVWTILVALTIFLILWVFELFGMSPAVAVRSLYTWIATVGFRFSRLGNHTYLNQRAAI